MVGFRITLLASALALSAVHSAADAQVPIPPQMYGSTLGDYEIALDELVSRLPEADDETPEYERGKLVVQARDVGIDYLRLLAMARHDGIDLSPLLLTDASTKITDSLARYVDSGSQAAPDNHPMFAEMLIEIARQRIEVSRGDKEALREHLALATHSLAAVGRKGNIPAFVEANGLSLEAEARRPGNGGGVVWNAIDALIDLEQHERAAKLSRAMIASADPAEVRPYQFALLRHAAVLRATDNPVEAAETYAELLELPDIGGWLHNTARYARIESVFEGGKYSTAAELAREELSRSPQDREVTRLLVRSYLEQGDRAGARALLENQFAKDKTQPPARGTVAIRGSQARTIASEIARHLYAEEDWDALEELVDRYAEVRGSVLSESGYSDVQDWIGVAAARFAVEEGSIDAETLQYGFSAAGRDKDRVRFDEVMRLYRTLPDRLDEANLEWIVKENERPGLLLPEVLVADDPGYVSYTTRWMAELVLEAREEGVPSPFPLSALQRRIAHSQERYEAGGVLDETSFSLAGNFAMARGEWQKVYEAELAQRKRSVVGARFRNEEGRRFYLECPGVIEKYRRLVPGGDLFDHVTNCDFTRYEKGLSAQSMAETALLIESDPQLAIEALEPAFAEVLARQFEDDEPRMGASDELIRARNDRRESARLMADLLWEEHGAGAGEQTKARAFELLQWAMLGRAGDAVIRGAAERIAATIDPELVDLTREYRDLSGELSQLPQIQAVKANPTPEEAAARRERDAASRRDREARESRAAQIRATIAEKFPNYFDFIQPRPLSVEEARERLVEDEAIVVLFPVGDQVHVVALDRERIDWTAAPISRFDLDRRVVRLLWDVGAPLDVSEDVHYRWAEEGGEGFPFARDVAHDLYRTLLQPVDGTLEGKKRVYVSAAGSLASLPLGILVVDPPRGEDGDPQALRDTSWLADRHALISLPSIASLRLLERASGNSSSDTALAGFGDPVLEGEAVQRGTSGRARNRSVKRSGGVNEPGLPLVERLRRLSRLPGTERELKAIRSTLGAPESAIRLQSEASETAVRNADLSDVSILAFATHGVMPAEIEGLTEPGLVMTPPLSASEANDGLLASSEIAALKLNADWVLLSACNTAVGGTAEAVNLTDAFFFAGARSVLASHWPVDDDAAEKLTTAAIGLQQRNPQLTRAEALQRAMQQVRLDASHDKRNADGSTSTWAHPSIWAPFSIYGDIDRPSD